MQAWDIGRTDSSTQKEKREKKKNEKTNKCTKRMKHYHCNLQTMNHLSSKQKRNCNHNSYIRSFNSQIGQLVGGNSFFELQRFAVQRLFRQRLRQLRSISFEILLVVRTKPRTTI
jgi:hypothetical protein